MNATMGLATLCGLMQTKPRTLLFTTCNPISWTQGVSKLRVRTRFDFAQTICRYRYERELEARSAECYVLSTAYAAPATGILQVLNRNQ